MCVRSTIASILAGSAFQHRRAGSLSTLACMAAVVCIFVPAARADPLQVQFGYSNQESPFFIQGNGETVPPLPGIAVEMAERAAADCGAEPTFARYPGGRLLALMQNNSIDAVLMLSFTPERMALGVYPMLEVAADPEFRIATLTYAFYVRSDSGVTWDGTTFVDLDHPIGVNNGWSIANDLQKLGLPVKAAKDTQNNFNMLLHNRIDAFAIQTTIGNAYIQAHALADRIKVLEPPISTKPYYLVFSHGWYAQHRDVADCMWRAIADQRETTMPDLLQRYHDTM